MVTDDLEQIVDAEYGRPHHAEKEFIESQYKRYLIAQHEEGGRWAVYSKDGRDDHFGGPHHSIDQIVDVEEELDECGRNDHIVSGVTAGMATTFATMVGLMFYDSDLLWPAGIGAAVLPIIAGLPLGAALGKLTHRISKAFKRNYQNLILAQNIEEGPHRVYSVDGKCHWFNGPFYDCTIFRSGKKTYLYSRDEGKDKDIFSIIGPYKKGDEDHAYGGQFADRGSFVNIGEIIYFRADRSEKLHTVERRTQHFHPHYSVDGFEFFDESAIKMNHKHCRDNAFGGRKFNPTKIITVNGEDLLIASASREDMFKLYACDGTTRALFGFPHKLIGRYLANTDPPLLSTFDPDSGNVRVFSEDGNNHWFGGEHAGFYGFTDDELLMLAKHEKEGKVRLYSIGGTPKRVFGVEPGRTCNIKTIKGVPFVEGINSVLFSRDNISFRWNEVNTSRYGLKAEYDDAYLLVKDWLRQEGCPVNHVPVSILERLADEGILEMSQEVFDKSPEELLASLGQLISPEKYLPRCRSGFDKQAFDHWADVVKMYLDSGREHIDLDDVLKGTVISSGDDRHKDNFIGALRYHLENGAEFSAEELGRYSQIHLDDFIVVEFHRKGGWSTVYKIINRGHTSQDLVQVLKIPEANANRSNIEREVAKHGSLDAALESMTRREELVNQRLQNTSADNLRPYHYTPVPSSSGWRKVVKADNTETIARVSQYIRGDTFEEYFQNNRVPTNKMFELFAKGAYALRFVHMKGNNHNDVKGDNLMVAENRNVYILDFGLSRFTGSASSIQGTRHCTAPEKLFEHTPSSEKSDQYSYGMIMYEAVVGKPALSYDMAENMGEFMRQVHEGILIPNFKLLESKCNDPQLAEIIKKTLAFKPENRFDSMRDVETQLGGNVTLRENYFDVIPS